MQKTHNPEKTTYTRIALLLIAIGSLIALDSYLDLQIIYKLWPLLTIMLGMGLVGIFIKRKTTGLLFLASGEYLLLFSGLALYCNFTSWGRMKSLWPLFVIFLAIVLLTLYFIDRRKRALLFTGLIMISFSVLFYFMFAIDVQYWWTIFILLGGSILISVHTK